MAIKKKGLLPSLQRHYDKIIAVLVLAGLLVSLVYVSQSTRKVQEDYERFDQALSDLSPAVPEASAVDTKLFEAAQLALANPFQMQTATNLTFLVPEERVWCVECRNPIKINAEVCPFCSSKQPAEGVSADWDSDGDGMPDEWEKKYGLNPLDPSDAHHDLDGDGFTNLEEYLAGTDPRDPKSHPPRIDFLRVDKIGTEKFPYVLQAVTRALGDEFRYQINHRPSGQTLFNIKIGDKLGTSDYVVKEAGTNKYMRKVEGYTEEREVEVPILKVQRESGGRVLTLAQGTVADGDYTITFICTKDNPTVDYIGRPDTTFTFDGENYEVIKIDNTGQSVVIRRVSDRQEIVVPRR